MARFPSLSRTRGSNEPDAPVPPVPTRWMDEVAALGHLVTGQGEVRLFAGFDRVAADHLLLPALAPHLTQAHRVAFPEEAAVADLAHRLNTGRNAALLAQLEQVSLALNACGIVPVVLKGMAHLLTGLWPTRGSRFVTDIDLLVPETDIARAYAATTELSGQPARLRVEEINHHKHVRAIHGAAGPAQVELHFGLFGRRWDRVLPPADVIGRSREVRCGQGRVALPCDGDMASIALLHGPLGHEQRLWRRDRLWMRDALDLAFLAAQERTTGGLCEAGRRLSDAGCGPVMAWSAASVRRTTGVFLPLPRGAPPARAIAVLTLACLERPRLHHRLRLAWRLAGIVPRAARLAYRLLTDGAARQRFVAKTSSGRLLPELVDFYILGR